VSKIFAEGAELYLEFDPASGFAVNNRLFEATGMGAVLVTEDAKNIQDLFVPELEVITYSSPADAAAKVQTILNDYEKYEGVGRAGQARTHAEHTHANRAQVIDATLKGLIRKQGS
jgi:spore maturation protein CgeB